MCGIVAYFGGTGNSLTRLLTGMSAIIYRAPDSTGVGLFGDEQEPIRARKAIGSVAGLSGTLLDSAAYASQARKLLELWEPAAGDPADDLKRQQRILEFEAFPPELYRCYLDGEKQPPVIDNLLSRNPDNFQLLLPGTPGRAAPLPVFPIRSVAELRHAVREMALEYDLSPVVVQTLIRKALEKTLATYAGLLRPGLSIPDIITAFDRMYETAFMEQQIISAPPADEQFAVQNPGIWQALWHALKEVSVPVPDDYDRDGVRGVFRILDAALMCRLPLRSEHHAAIQEMLEFLWPEARHIPNTDWRTLYWAEKGTSVYGRAAAAVYEYLQQKEVFPAWGDDNRLPVISLCPGRTDPLCLDFLLQPVLGQGRWALQSPVSIKNAHPFFDAHRHRTIVLNGQFSGEVEAEARDFLSHTVDVPFRSENSSEYFAMLWGYYFDILESEKNRYEAVKTQVDAGLEAYFAGSQAIDYKIFQMIRNRPTEAVDEMAFLEAVRRMTGRGGQIAVAGMSLHSPRHLYIACHNRPAFLVQRADNDDLMVVSDINAALGLFPQSLIHETTEALNRLRHRQEQEMDTLRQKGAQDREVQATKKRHHQDQNSRLEPFRVTVYPLEGEEIFVRVTTALENGNLTRRPAITDFEGNPRPEIEAFSTILNPLQMRKQLYSTFYQTHLHEIPERIENLLHTYLPDGVTIPRLPVRERILRRRFGPHFNGLKRIILAGMGSSGNVALMAKPFFHDRLPETEIRVIQPVEIDEVAASIIPDNDLVILLSWSATTADMVEFAKELQKLNVLMIGITEKVFGDMALIAARSGGVIPVYSGEEVTISAIKSVPCMLLSLDLFGIWLAAGKSRHGTGTGQEFSAYLRQLSPLLNSFLADSAAGAFCDRVARESAQAHAVFIIGDCQAGGGVCREATLKLEETSWTAIGRVLDYRELLVLEDGAGPLRHDPAGHLVIVHATGRNRQEEAFSAMARLKKAGIPFVAVVTKDHPAQAAIARDAEGRCIFLPRLEANLQPLMDTLLYYRFARRFAEAHGRQADEFPRNRAKSVTAGRSRGNIPFSPARELQVLAEQNRRILSASAAENIPDGELLWEKTAASEEALYYRRLRDIGDQLASGAYNPLCPEMHPAAVNRLAALIFDELSQDGEIIFVPLDCPADAAVRNVACQWSRFLRCAMRTALIGESVLHFPEDALLVFVASRPPETELLWQLLGNVSGHCLWLGAEIPAAAAQMLTRSIGYFPLPDSAGPAAGDLLYASLSLLLIRATGIRRPDQAAILEQHFAQAGNVIRRVLDDADLSDEIAAAMTANRDYRTAFYIGASTGTGPAWTGFFDRHSPVDLAWHPFGESAHGPLATVDNRVAEKFVQIRDRSELVNAFGDRQVAEWERRFLGQMEIAELLDNGFSLKQKPFPSVFYAEGNWYFPVLRKEYDPAGDNLIILDATRNHYFSHALDELATCGCRYARMIVITQTPFCSEPGKRALFNHPVSHLLCLPALEGGEGAEYISGFLLPFAMNLVGTRMAALRVSG